MIHDTKYKVILREDKIKANGQVPIFIRITKHRKVKYISVQESCLITDFNGNTGFLWESKPRLKDNKRDGEKSDVEITINPRAKKINSKISDHLEAAEQGERDLKKGGEVISSHNIKQKITDVKPTGRDYLLFFKSYSDTIIKAKKSYNTWRTYESTHNLLTDYQKGKPLTFEDISEDYLERLEMWFLKEKYNPNTIRKHFQRIGLIWKRVKKQKLVTWNPFEDLELKEGKSIYTPGLSMQEMQAINKLTLSEPLNTAKNIFIFAYTHAGVRVSDLLKLKWQEIENDRFEYQMKKTGKFTSVKIQPTGKKIIDSYRNEANLKTDYVFPLLENGMDEKSEYWERQIQSKTTVVNRHLKVIAKLADINKKITTKLARHSFGTEATNQNINAFEIGYTMGHSKISTTQQYSGGGDSKRSDKVMDTLFENFEG
ncbi:tyrosine-type recombinase/integrase [Flavitalea sp.]|nr:site-specific integrase [Flavitalea sp.]